MTQTTAMVIDRYITIFDRAAHDPGALDGLITHLRNKLLPLDTSL
ncbi:hypothetical protein [Actinophytocola sp.]